MLRATVVTNSSGHRFGKKQSKSSTTDTMRNGCTALYKLSTSGQYITIVEGESDTRPRRFRFLKRIGNI